MQKNICIIENFIKKIATATRDRLQKNPLLFDGIFRRAVRGFAEQVSQPPLRQDIVVPENLGVTALDVVLMAWLVVCDESAGAAKKLPTRNGLYDRVLTTEFAQWRKAPALVEISGTHMRQAAATLRTRTCRSARRSLASFSWPAGGRCEVKQ